MPRGRAVDDDNTAQNARANNVNLVSHPDPNGPEGTRLVVSAASELVRVTDGVILWHSYDGDDLSSDLKACDTSAILMLALATCKSTLPPTQSSHKLGM